MQNVKCNHCHIEFEHSVMIKENNLTFCCHGCKSVYYLLQDSGLDSFYDKLGNNSIAPPVSSDTNTEKFDRQAFEKKYVSVTNNNKQIDLIIDGIHCSACVWLNEKVLHDTNGIIDASINYTNNKASIQWNSEKILLSQIIEKIRSIGYDAYPYDANINEQKSIEKKRTYLIKMMTAILISLNIMMISVAKYTGFFTGIDDQILSAIHIAEFILSTPVLFYSGSIFFKGAFYGLKNKIINMDFLISSGSSLTYVYSIYVMFGGIGHTYFDSVAMIITFILVGKYLEVIGKKSAVDTLDLIKSKIPIHTTIVKNNKKIEVLIDEVCQGDMIELKAGDKACVDGTLHKGIALFDESNISGESLPVEKKKGSQIIGSTINLDSPILYKATTDFKHSILNEIVTMIEDSLKSKPNIENKANLLSRSFSVSILLISIMTFLIWKFYFNDFENALINSISVIIIACPCALALATPMASLTGISWLSSKKILFKKAKDLETMAKVNTVVFDKTGTLTNGQLIVVKEKLFIQTKDDLSIIATICSVSKHQISQAVFKHLSNQSIRTKDIRDVQIIAGKGMIGFVGDKKIIAGNMALFDDNNIKTDIESTMSLFVVAIDDIVVAIYELEDTIKTYASDMINYLHSQKINTIMLTGDNEKVAKRIANEIGIFAFKANMLPLDKANYIKTLKKKNNIVAMVGDGLNDAPALSQADISVAMKSGADISIGLSDIIILDNNLKNLEISFKISKRVFRFIKQNLMISLIYNVLTIPLAIFGFVIPLFAALLMSLSSLMVVGNSLRIKTKGKI